MTIRELISLLQTYPENMSVAVSIPEEILDDGYVNSSRLCVVNGLWLRHDRPLLEIDYDRHNYIEIE